MHTDTKSMYKVTQSSRVACLVVSLSLSLNLQPPSYFSILYMFQQHFIELTMLLSASFTCLDACCCHGLRLPETTCLLTYLYLHDVRIKLDCSLKVVY